MTQFNISDGSPRLAVAQDQDPPVSSRFITVDVEAKDNAKLKIVGVGGGGCNAVDSMIKRGLKNAQFVAINTDSQGLSKSSAQYKIQVGSKLTRGLGAGANPDVGRMAVEEDRDKIAEILRGTDMVFLTAGMGGGTGTGGLPVVASIAKNLDILTVAIVTKPFPWEGKTRMMNAEKGIQELRQYVDSLIIIPNAKLLDVVDGNLSFVSAMDKSNEVLYEATRGIADIISVDGYVNVDFADVRSVMLGSGQALMGCGIASGQNRTIEAAKKAISSPYLEGVKIHGAKNVLLNVTGSSNLTLKEINEGNEVIFSTAGDDVNVIFGCVIKEEMNDYVSYTVIATGFDQKSKVETPKKTAIEIKPKPKAGSSVAQQSGRFKAPGSLQQTEKEGIQAEEEETLFSLKSPKTNLDSDISDDQIGFDYSKYSNTEFEDLNTEDAKNRRRNQDDIDSEFLADILD